jgi:hypothetical protein
MLFSKFKIEFEIFKKVFKKKKKNMSNKKNASKSPARAFLEHKRVACPLQSWGSLLVSWFGLFRSFYELEKWLNIDI